MFSSLFAEMAIWGGGETTSQNLQVLNYDSPLVIINQQFHFLPNYIGSCVL